MSEPTMGNGDEQSWKDSIKKNLDFFFFLGHNSRITKTNTVILIKETVGRAMGKLKYQSASHCYKATLRRRTWRNSNSHKHFSAELLPWVQNHLCSVRGLSQPLVQTFSSGMFSRSHHQSKVKKCSFSKIFTSLLLSAMGEKSFFPGFWGFFVSCFINF